MKLKSFIPTSVIIFALPILSLATDAKPGSNLKPWSFGDDQTIVDIEKVVWTPLEVSGFPPGAKIAVLRGGLNTGGSESLLKLPPSYKVPSHSHTSDELYIWVKGAFRLIARDKTEIRFDGPAYISFPGNAPQHGLQCGKDEDCIFYLRLSRPFDIKYQH